MSKPFSGKLTQEEVDTIRKLWLEVGHFSMRDKKRLCVTMTDIAEDFEVHQSTISRVIHHKGWIEEEVK